MWWSATARSLFTVVRSSVALHLFFCGVAHLSHPCEKTVYSSTWNELHLFVRTLFPPEGTTEELWVWENTDKLIHINGQTSQTVVLLSYIMVKQCNVPAQAPPLSRQLMHIQLDETPLNRWHLGSAHSYIYWVAKTSFHGSFWRKNTWLKHLMPQGCRVLQLGMAGGAVDALILSLL